MTIETIWQDFLKIVREEVGSRVVETWFKAVKLTRWDAFEKIAYLEAPNMFVKDWISNHYNNLFQQHLGRLLGEDRVSVVFVESNATTDSPQKPPTLAKKGELSFYDPARPVVGVAQRKHPLQKMSGRIRGMLNDHYCFENFVVGPSNTLAFSAAQAAAENPGTLYNPLFLYGGSGLGKTHLLHAVGNYIKDNHKKMVVLYQSADRFIHDYINAIRFNKVYQFELRYKDVDVLLIDDIQFISNKEQTQETFFHIFNTLHQSNKQMVFSSDSMPCDIAGLAERMRSRLEGGLIADVQPPSLETMMAILQKKAEAQGHPVSEDVAHFIASQRCSSVRELEGMLIRVIAFASLTKQEIDLRLAEKILTQTRQRKRELVDLHVVARAVAKHYSCTLHDLRSCKRHKELVHARHITMYLMKRLTDFSLREIGKFLQRKDHSTVIHAYEKIKQQIEDDPLFAQEVHNLERTIDE